MKTVFELFIGLYTFFSINLRALLPPTQVKFYERLPRLHEEVLYIGSNGAVHLPFVRALGGWLMCSIHPHLQCPIGDISAFLFIFKTEQNVCKQVFFPSQRI